MTTRSNAKYVSSFGISLAITSIVSAVLVPIKEESEAVMGLLAGATGHHWITHGVLMLILFVVLGFVLARRSTSSDEGFRGTTTAVLAGTIIGGLIIFGFFLLE